MILVAPDKFKGTLSAQEAAQIIAEVFPAGSCVKTPMADGGEGTAAIVASAYGWDARNGYYVDKNSRTAVIDSSAIIGLSTNPEQSDFLRASSAPLGVKVREIIQGGCEKVIIGVGGTGCCDGGLGFLMGLGIDNYRVYRDKLLGLCDVQVPLVPEANCPDSRLLDYPSALMFAPQKGAKAIDIPVLHRRLLEVQREYGHGRTSPYDGAGGGLGFALASAIGAECVNGAQYVLDNYDIRWDQIDLVITGEGCVDSQTFTGKAPSIVAREANKHGMPCFVIGGTVKYTNKENDAFAHLISADQFLTEKPLDKETATERLRSAAIFIRDSFRI